MIGKSATKIETAGRTIGWPAFFVSEAVEQLD